MGKRVAHLPRSFYSRPTLTVARDLIGQTLVHMQKVSGRTRRIAGIITETEAYCGEEDLACHARHGRTKRTDVMYGQAGHAYVYFTYGNHWMLNIVTQALDEAHAVLIRAVEPTEGLELIARRRRNRDEKDWTNGPGKLTRAFGIDSRYNGLDLTDPAAIMFIQAGQQVPNGSVKIGPRVGLGATPEPWLSKPWRFLANLSKK